MDTERNNEFLQILKQKLTPTRLYHSVCVAEQAEHLAKIFGADTKKAYTAGLIHDIMRYESAEDMLKLIDSDKKNVLSDSERKITVTLHAVAGEVYLRKNLGVTDEEILSAVRYHTTGKENMSLLEKIIYVADLTSADRDYPDVEDVRRTAEISLEKATLRGLSFTIESNAKQNRPIHIDTVKAYNYLAERIEK